MFGLDNEFESALGQERRPGQVLVRVARSTVEQADGEGEDHPEAEDKAEEPTKEATHV
jgi:hypothetical protein